jgi:hypothetical protein
MLRNRACSTQHPQAPNATAVSVNSASTIGYGDIMLLAAWNSVIPNAVKDLLFRSAAAQNYFVSSGATFQAVFPAQAGIQRL